MGLSAIHGRQEQLDRLTGACQTTAEGQARLVVLYGRRRVGKTFLLQHLQAHIQDLSGRAVYVSATREAGRAQLERFASAFEAADIQRPSTASWSEFWDDLRNIATGTPINLFLDEVPYLIEDDASWPSVLQASWDAIRHSGRPTPLTVILTGSAISTMTNLISSRGALFERPDLLMRLDPFDLPTSTSFLSTDDPTTAVEAYTACGGYPLLLSRWDTQTTAMENLVRLAGDPVGALTTNASTLLLDIGDKDNVHRVLGAIGRGANKLSEIGARAGQRPERPLSLLERSGLIQRSYPIGDRSPKAALLKINDHYLRLWFSMIEPHLQLIDGGQGSAIIRSQMPAWNNLVADVFERSARAHAIRLADNHDEIGEWWTDRPEKAQIDVVGRTGSRWTLVGEVKWKDTFTLSDFRQLQRHLRVAGDRASSARLAVWTRTSVSDEVIAISPSITAYTARDVCGLSH